jgi:hypothetical protein
MAIITIHDLQLAGQGFFADSESFMDELGRVDLEISATVGGITPAAGLVSLYLIAGGTYIYTSGMPY